MVNLVFVLSLKSCLIDNSVRSMPLVKVGTVHLAAVLHETINALSGAKLQGLQVNVVDLRINAQCFVRTIEDNVFRLRASSPMVQHVDTLVRVKLDSVINQVGVPLSDGCKIIWQ